MSDCPPGCSVNFNIPHVINVRTRGLLAAETMYAIVRWLANLNIKRNMTSMFVNKKHRYCQLIKQNCNIQLHVLSLL